MTPESLTLEHLLAVPMREALSRQAASLEQLFYWTSRLIDIKPIDKQDLNSLACFYESLQALEASAQALQKYPIGKTHSALLSSAASSAKQARSLISLALLHRVYLISSDLEQMSRYCRTHFLPSQKSPTRAERKQLAAYRQAAAGYCTELHLLHQNIYNPSPIHS